MYSTEPAHQQSTNSNVYKNQSSRSKCAHSNTDISLQDWSCSVTHEEEEERLLSIPSFSMHLVWVLSICSISYHLPKTEKSSRKHLADLAYTRSSKIAHMGVKMCLRKICSKSSTGNSRNRPKCPKTVVFRNMSLYGLELLNGWS